MYSKAPKFNLKITDKLLKQLIAVINLPKEDKTEKNIEPFRAVINEITFFKKMNVKISSIEITLLSRMFKFAKFKKGERLFK